MTPDQIAAGMDGRLRPVAPFRSKALLPSPWVQNHAAFLSGGADGLSCAWFAGSLEGKSDISIFASTLAGDCWSPAEALTDDPERSEQNPVLFDAPDGRRLLIHTAQPGGNQDAALVRLRERGGVPRDLPLPAGTFVRGAVQVRGDGAWLLPLFFCTHRPGFSWTGSHDTAALAIGTGGGASWRIVAVPGSIGCVHMSLEPLGSADHYAAFYRRRQADFVHRSETRDGGESWSVPEPTDVPNNNSSIAVARLGDGRIALVCNPVNAAMSADRRASLYDELGGDAAPAASGGCNPVWGVRRAPLALCLSSDGGVSFPERHVIEDGPGTCLSNDSLDGRNRELSYPALAIAADGTIDIAYTLHRRAVRHVRLKPGWLRSGTQSETQ